MIQKEREVEDKTGRQNIEREAVESDKIVIDETNTCG